MNLGHMHEHFCIVFPKRRWRAALISRLAWANRRQAELSTYALRQRWRTPIADSSSFGQEKLHSAERFPVQQMSVWEFTLKLWAFDILVAQHVGLLQGSPFGDLVEDSIHECPVFKRSTNMKELPDQGILPRVIEDCKDNYQFRDQ